MQNKAIERARLRDVMRAEQSRATDLADRMGLHGFVHALLIGPDRVVKQRVLVPNLITDVGDEYYAKQGAVGVSPANLTAPVLVKGMKLGTGTTAVAKNGAGAALVTYTSGSQKAFDAGNPSVATLGAGAGWRLRYVTTWGAGVVTVSGLAEAVIVNPATLTDATSAAAETISRALLSPVVNKGAGDTLVVTWDHTFNGT